MTKKIDEARLIRDFQENKTYAEIALKHKCSLATISQRAKRLGLRMRRQKKQLFSSEEKDILRSLMDTYRGRKQLLEILRSK